MSAAPTIPKLLDRQCRLRPQALAADDGQHRWTYAALWQASTAVAAGLHVRGVRRGDRVAMLLPRGLEALACLTGIGLAEAAYVPLDPAEPPARLADLLQDCAPACLITGPQKASNAGSGVPCVTVADLLSANATPVEIGGSGEDAAYVMYTSGSTGRPKGVIVPHRAVLRLVVDADYVALGPEQVLLQLAPLAFDASTFEVWGALLNGGSLFVLADEQPSLDAIGTAIRVGGVTTAWLTAGLFHAMADQRIEALRPLRQLLAGGEVLSPRHVAAVLRACPTLRLINGYGPTENTTFTCCHTIRATDPAGGAIPIGKPIRGTTVHLLDGLLQPVPAGEIGQLCTGGAGVALGYLNRSELTEARFVPDPFPADTSATMYLTGDRARLEPDGTLTFHGRIDRQVKLNGHRIELEEVEQALRDQPGVAEAVCLLDEDAQGRKCLTGFVTVMPGATLAQDVLVSALMERLPRWSVPGRIVPMAGMKLTPNGKIDRAALAALDAPAPASAPPGSKLEQRLAALVADVLGLGATGRQIGRDDNFFDLGATSLQLIELHARIVRTLQPEFGLMTLFAAPRISLLAACISGDAAPAAMTPPQERARRAAAAMGRLRASRAG